MALTGAQKGIEEPRTQSSMHTGGRDPGDCSSENPRMQCSQSASKSCVPEVVVNGRRSSVPGPLLRQQGVEAPRHPGFAASGNSIPRNA